MTYLLSIAATFLLWGGFTALTVFEGSRGVRFFAPTRDRLDTVFARIEFVIAHVNFSAWLKDESRRIAARIGHDVAHLSLQGVRFAERLLTRVVKHFRTKEAEAVPRETERAFIGTLANFKAHLATTRPEISEMGKMG